MELLATRCDLIVFADFDPRVFAFDRMVLDLIKEHGDFDRFKEKFNSGPRDMCIKYGNDFDTFMRLMPYKLGFDSAAVEKNPLLNGDAYRLARKLLLNLSDVTVFLDLRDRSAINFFKTTLDAHQGKLAIADFTNVYEWFGDEFGGPLKALVDDLDSLVFTIFSSSHVTSCLELFFALSVRNFLERAADYKVKAEKVRAEMMANVEKQLYGGEGETTAERVEREMGEEEAARTCSSLWIDDLGGAGGSDEEERNDLAAAAAGPSMLRKR